MNCFAHTDEVAVASCSQGCGRGLCRDCARAYEPPVCPACFAALQNELLSVQMAAIQEVKRRMTVNWVVLATCALAFVVQYFALSAKNQDVELVLFALMLYIPIMIWGFFAFRWLMQSLSDLTGMVFFLELSRNGCLAILIGCMVCAAFAPIIIPIMLILQWQELRRLEA